MSNTSALYLCTLSLSLAAIITGCGSTEEPTEPASGETVPAVEVAVSEPAPVADSESDTRQVERQAIPESAPQESVATGTDTNDPAGTVTDDGEEEAIDPEELELSGTIELKQYTVAWVGSGTMGGGTLTVEGKEYPFKIAGLGVGGFGASTIDATGVVYDMPNLDAFPGTYGNARLGLTAGDSGGGKLWLKSTTGVVIELESEMRGLALAGGVDGIIIEWDEAEESSFDRARDSTEETVGEGIEYGADAVQKGVDGVKGWFKKDE